MSEIIFWYKNHQGKESYRRVRPTMFYFGATEWHPTHQMLMRGIDLDKNAERDFAVADMKSFVGSSQVKVNTPLQEMLDDRQRVVADWGTKCFGAEHMADAIVRSARHLEESAELGQSVGLPKDHALRVLDHVYARPAGNPVQEVGGSANTLMALCSALGLSFNACQVEEIERVLAKDPSYFAERNLTKVKEVDAEAVTVCDLDGKPISECLGAACKSHKRCCWQ